ncbi:MAG: universal stress protein [Thermoleophilia bacterium]
MITPVVTGAAATVQLSDLGVVSSTLKVVLTATDGSEPAVRATQHAVLIAKISGARLHVVHVDVGIDELRVPELPISDAQYARLDPALRALVIAQRLAELNGVEAQLEITRGGVARCIIDAAKREDAELIVVGDTGRTGLSRLALGSVAEAVVKASTLPVLVVKAD